MRRGLPSVIQIPMRGRRKRIYVPALAFDQTQCGFCGAVFIYIEYRAHIETCEDNPFHVLRSPRTGETPEQILDRLAKELGCAPRQVCDRVIAMLKERRKNGKP